ncbi:MAG: hypothetical protein WD492_06990 [Alkalispirochaeta sp.]
MSTALAPDILAGAELIKEIMADGEWHLRVDVTAIMRDMGITGSEFSLCEYLRLAESDSGRYWCLPDTRTPAYAPDGS